MKLKYVLVILLIFGFASTASANTISFNPGTNEITITGFNATHPCTFLDVYNADVAGGWGVVSKYNNEQYSINCDVKICTYFYDTNKQIKFGNDFGLHIHNNAHVKFGTLISSSKKLGKDGCDFIFDLPFTYSYGLCIYNGGYIEAYSCSFCNIHPDQNGQYYIILDPTNITRFWNCLFTNGEQITITGISDQKNTFVNTDVVNMRYGLAIMGEFSKDVFNNLKVYENKYGTCFIMVAQDVYANNIIIEESSMYTVYLFGCSATFYMTDCISDWIFRFLYSPDAIFYRQHSFNLQTNPNAKITIMNHTDIVYQDYAYDNGTIDEQILTMGHYQQSTGNVLNSQNPYTIEISKPGYQTYSNTFNLTEPIVWNIGLEPERIPLDKSGIVTGLGFLIGCMIVSIGLIIMKRREFL